METTIAADGPGFCPSHPGELLREEVLPALGLSVMAAAAALDVSRQMLHRILAERASVSPEMAVRLGKLCGDGARVWLAMQAAHDLWLAERALAGVVDRIPAMRMAEG